MNKNDLIFGDIVIINNEKYVISSDYLCGEFEHNEYDCELISKIDFNKISAILRNGELIYASNSYELEQRINEALQILENINNLYVTEAIKILKGEKKKEPNN